MPLAHHDELLQALHLNALEFGLDHALNVRVEVGWAVGESYGPDAGVFQRRIERDPKLVSLSRVTTRQSLVPKLSSSVASANPST